MTHTFRDGTLNVQYTNSQAQIREDLELLVDHRVQIAGLQEISSDNAKAAYADFLHDHPTWRGYRAGENAIVWRKDIFHIRAGTAVSEFASAGLQDVSPHRYVLRADFDHIASRLRNRYMTTHAVSEYYKDVVDHRAFRRAAAQQWTYKCLEMTTEALQAKLRGELNGFIRIGFDGNLPGNDRSTWWYYTNLLSPLYAFPSTGRIDQLGVTRNSMGGKIEAGKREAVQGHTDHALLIDTRSW